MPTYDLKKECEYCNIAIPDDFNNLICVNCYPKVEKMQEKARQMAKETEKHQIAVNPNAPTNPGKNAPVPMVESQEAVSEPPETPVESKFGIKDPNYQENPEMNDKQQILANLAQFIYSHDEAKGRQGKLLWYPQRHMYTFIKNYCLTNIQNHPQYPKYIWKPDIVDVGCGSGVGANVMSQEANLVWGIDKNVWSIEFAKEAFERVKNNYYYSSQVTFDVIDIIKENRELHKFDIVTAIEVIEHIHDTHTFLKQCIGKFEKINKKGHHLTEYFFSTPNRAHKKLNKDKPKNPYHVREWTAIEFSEYLKKYFKVVNLLNQKGEPIPDDSEVDEVILAHCKESL